MSGIASLDRLAMKGDAGNVEHFKAKLLNKRGELIGSIARAEQEARRVVSVPGVGDPVDRVADDAAVDEALQSGSADSAMLQQVEEALRRIELGTYGNCELCGKAIEPGRLEAIPWTPYCLTDQKKLEQDQGLGAAADVVPLRFRM